MPTPLATSPAATATAKKTRNGRYDGRYVILGDKLVAFGIETTGALGAKAGGFLHRVAVVGGCSQRAIAHRYHKIDGRHRRRVEEAPGQNIRPMPPIVPPNAASAKVRQGLPARLSLSPVSTMAVLV